MHLLFEIFYFLNQLLLLHLGFIFQVQLLVDPKNVENFEFLMDLVELLHIASKRALQTSVGPQLVVVCRAQLLEHHRQEGRVELVLARQKEGVLVAPFVQRHFDVQAHVHNQVLELQRRLQLRGVSNHNNVELGLAEDVQHEAVFKRVHEQVGADPLHDFEHPVVERLLVLAVVRLILSEQIRLAV